MTTPPNPPGPTLRVRLVYAMSGGEGGNRFYMTFTGTRPSGATCSTIATDIATAYGTWLQGLMSGDVALTEIDVLDITDPLGLSGQWTGNLDGSRSGTGLLTQSCAVVESNIARRYRGGKPRMFLPAGVELDLLDQSTWSSAFITAVNSNVAGFFTAVAAISVGGTILSSHVNLSFFQGFKNIANTSGRERAVPQYRAVALADTISGYSTKAQVSSQRRRRHATTP